MYKRQESQLEHVDLPAEQAGDAWTPQRAPSSATATATAAAATEEGRVLVFAFIVRQCPVSDAVIADGSDYRQVRQRRRQSRCTFAVSAAAAAAAERIELKRQPEPVAPATERASGESCMSGSRPRSRTSGEALSATNIPKGHFPLAGFQNRSLIRFIVLPPSRRFSFLSRWTLALAVLLLSRLIFPTRYS